MVLEAREHLTLVPTFDNKAKDHQNLKVWRIDDLLNPSFLKLSKIPNQACRSLENGSDLQHGDLTKE